MVQSVFYFILNRMNIYIFIDWRLSGIMTSKHYIRDLISRMTRSSVIIPYLVHFCSNLHLLSKKISNMNNFMKKYTTALKFKYNNHLMLPFNFIIDLDLSIQGKLLYIYIQISNLSM